MIFKWIDRLIDKKVASAFNLYRKIGRRAERSYHTAYKDWLLYISRRSKDVSVKITMVGIIVSLYFIIRGLRRLFKMAFMDEDYTISMMRDTLNHFNQTGSTFQNSKIVATEIIATRKNAEIMKEFIEQRDK